MKPRLIVIVGPTATGKTAVAIELAHKLHGEVISADSMQIYDEMRIGTARPTLDEQQGIPHHLMGFVSPSETYSVACYQREANDCIARLHAAGKQPIVAGGTGLYINALTYELDFTHVAADQAYRDQLSAAYDENPALVYGQLEQLDAQAAQRIHLHDKKRVIRRLEILHSGTTETYDFRKPRQDYEINLFGLTRERERLYAGIERRVDCMRAEGLTAEARTVYDRYGAGITAFLAIGYKEFLPFFCGEADEDMVYETIKRNTRRFAKRQLTWFRRDPRIIWMDVDKYPSAQAIAQEILIKIENGMEIEKEL